MRFNTEYITGHINMKTDLSDRSSYCLRSHFGCSNRSAIEDLESGQKRLALQHLSFLETSVPMRGMKTDAHVS